MCGITGFVGKGDIEILNRMNKSLHHRGPDDQGSLILHDRVGLAQSRLSIIDLSPAGHQPMGNENGKIWIVFNGEIYNYLELKRELSSRHEFKGHSDTEVIIHLYEEIGPEVFSKIQGMFAIALYDVRKDLLFLARDRMGKKPLYWSVQDKTLLFGSELKALIDHPSFRKNVDLESLNAYLFHEYVPTPRSIFENTWKLEPGTFLTWDGTKTEKTMFWRPSFLPKSQDFSADLKTLDSLLSQSVSDRLVSDVPLGVFLSGGIDSSAIAYYASKLSKEKVKTFSIGFEEKSFDESSHAKKVAAHLGTEHYEKILSMKDCLDLIPEIGNSLDEPMADASIVPTYLLSKFTRENVTVALGGDGGDELFAGYDTFLAHRFARLYRVVPESLKDRMIRPMLGHLPTSFSNMSLDFKLKRFVEGFEEDHLRRNQRWLSAFDRDGRSNLFSEGYRKKISSYDEFDQINKYKSEMDSKSLYDELGYIYERMYMMDQVLVKVDRASMMNSLEVRSPFLDTGVVEFANHLPEKFKFRGLERKYILKKAMEGKLPREIIYRKKKGFGMPIAEWLRGDLKNFTLDLLGKSSIGEAGYFDPAYVQKLVQEHLEGKKDNRKQLWTLLVFMMWWRRWIK